MEKTKAQLKLWRAVRLALKLVERGEIWEDEQGEWWKRLANGTWLNVSGLGTRGQAFIDGGGPKRLGANRMQVCVWLDMALGALYHTEEIGKVWDSLTTCSDGKNRYRVQRTVLR